MNIRAAGTRNSNNFSHKKPPVTVVQVHVTQWVKVWEAFTFVINAGVIVCQSAMSAF